MLLYCLGCAKRLEQIDFFIFRTFFNAILNGKCCFFIGKSHEANHVYRATGLSVFGSSGQKPIMLSQTAYGICRDSTIKCIVLTAYKIDKPLRLHSIRHIKFIDNI